MCFFIAWLLIALYISSLENDALVASKLHDLNPFFLFALCKALCIRLALFSRRLIRLAIFQPLGTATLSVPCFHEAFSQVLWLLQQNNSLYLSFSLLQQDSRRSFQSLECDRKIHNSLYIHTILCLFLGLLKRNHDSPIVQNYF